MAVLFDLDGTLIDTAHDFVLAAQNLHRKHSYSARVELNYNNLSAWVSFGSRKFLDAAFENITDEDIKHFINEYIYTEFQGSTPYTGINNILKQIARHNMPWGIVTNKPGHLTDKLLAKINLSHPPGVVVSGDTLDKAKPHPEPILHACNLLNTTPNKCLYIGDAARDILAGNAAGTKTIAALYGYIHNVDEAKSSWPADRFVDNVDELSTLIQTFITTGEI